MVDRLLAKVRIHAALHYGEKGLLVAIEGFRFPEAFRIAFQPALREIEALAGVGMVGVAGTALVEGHADVGAYDALGIHIVFRSESMPAAVDMALEGAAFRSELAYGTQAEHLEAAAVGEDGTVPVLELVKSARRPEDIQSGTEIEMICIAEDDLGFDIFLKVFMVYPLYGPDSAYGHEDRGAYIAVAGMQDSATGGGMKVGMYLFKFHRPKISKLAEKR